jgi:hypothetical protein
MTRSCAALAVLPDRLYELLIFRDWVKPLILHHRLNPMCGPNKNDKMKIYGYFGFIHVFGHFMTTIFHFFCVRSCILRRFSHISIIYFAKQLGSVIDLMQCRLSTLGFSTCPRHSRLLGRILLVYSKTLFIIRLCEELSMHTMMSSRRN